MFTSLLQFQPINIKNPESFKTNLVFIRSVAKKRETHSTMLYMPELLLTNSRKCLQKYKRKQCILHVEIQIFNFQSYKKTLYKKNIHKAVEAQVRLKSYGVSIVNSAPVQANIWWYCNCMCASLWADDGKH